MSSDKIKVTAKYTVTTDDGTFEAPTRKGAVALAEAAREQARLHKRLDHFVETALWDAVDSRTLRLMHNGRTGDPDRAAVRVVEAKDLRADTGTIEPTAYVPASLTGHVLLWPGETRAESIPLVGRPFAWGCAGKYRPSWFATIANDKGASPHVFTAWSIGCPVRGTETFYVDHVTYSCPEFVKWLDEVRVSEGW